jgi:hypothetical protein
VKLYIETLRNKLGKYLVVIPWTITLESSCGVVPITHKEAYNLMSLLLKKVGSNRGVYAS